MSEKTVVNIINLPSNMLQKHVVFIAIVFMSSVKVNSEILVFWGGM